MLPGKPLVEAPEFADRVRDTDKEPYWIPGAFPTIFQNETGDLHNHPLKETDILTWGPHIMRSRGWHAQAHMTFCYWWLNMVQRTQVLSAKKWYVRDNPKATGYTVDDMRNTSVSNAGQEHGWLYCQHPRHTGQQYTLAQSDPDHGQAN